MCEEEDWGSRVELKQLRGLLVSPWQGDVEPASSKVCVTARPCLFICLFACDDGPSQAAYVTAPAELSRVLAQLWMSAFD